MEAVYLLSLDHTDMGWSQSSLDDTQWGEEVWLPRKVGDMKIRGFNHDNWDIVG